MTWQYPVKRFYLIVLVAAYIFFCIPVFPVFYLSPRGYRKVNARLVSLFSKLLLRLLGVIIFTHPYSRRFESGYLIVSNHLSYLDVLILSSFFPGCFVTSVEIKQTPFLGHITSLAGCLFVERRSRQFLGQETLSLGSTLKSGLNVIVFPEGTSTNGETVLRFRQPLFWSAIHAGKDILPVSISYEKINHAPVTVQNRDQVFWYGSMTFGDHFAGLAQIHHIQVKLVISPLIRVSYRDTPAGLSEKAYYAVKKSYSG